MKFLPVLALLGTTSATSPLIQALRGGETGRQLLPQTTCIGSSLSKNAILRAGESICTEVRGEWVYFGIFTSAMPDDPGYTMYRVELRSDNGTYDHAFQGVGTNNPDVPPVLKLQGDAHLVFNNGGFSQCVAEPGTQVGQLTIGTGNDGGLLLQITDSSSKVVWKYGGSFCYPNEPDRCRSVLEKREILSWRDYICTYDSQGQIAYKFGLSRDMGLMGLWKGNTLIWRPGPNWQRGQYFHFQGDGHLTLYSVRSSGLDYSWSSDDCIDFTAQKLVLTSDGDVQELNEAGAIVWTLLGSQADITSAATNPKDSVPELCMPSVTCVVPPTVPLFEIEGNVDVGDTMIRPGDAFAAPCGTRCYDVRDNGDDPPFDPQEGDTFRFAYKTVSATKFRFRAKVCGTKCNDEPWTYNTGIMGRAGLDVRESLHPKARDIFAGHTPNYQAEYAIREEFNGATVYDMDGSPDVECLWVTLERRDRDQFSFWFNYLDWDGDECSILEEKLVYTNVTVPDMPETVLVGLAVSSNVAAGNSPSDYCAFTEARFSEIQYEAF